MPTYASPGFTATYQGLCDKIADTLNRADLTAAIPDFTVLATARIQRDMARVRHPQAISRALATLTANYAPLPGDFLAAYQLMEQDGTKAIEYVSPEHSRQLLVDSAYTAPARPYYYTIIGNTLRILPPPSATAPEAVDLWYYATLPALNTSTTTNWVLTKYPDLYLYGSLVHSAPYLKNDERIAMWDSIYNRILSDIEIEAERGTRSQTVLKATSRAF